MNRSTPHLPVHHQLLEFTQNSCPLSQWYHPAISSSVFPFSSCPQSLPSGSFPMSPLFAWGGQSIGVSASVSVHPMNTQNWPPLQTYTIPAWLNPQKWNHRYRGALIQGAEHKLHVDFPCEGWHPNPTPLPGQQDAWQGLCQGGAKPEITHNPDPSLWPKLNGKILHKLLKSRSKLF